MDAETKQGQKAPLARPSMIGGKSKLIDALARIAGLPPATYSKDQLTHANNTIVEMQSIAVAALCSDEADSAKDEPVRKLIAAALEYADAWEVYSKAFARNGDSRRYDGLPEGATPVPLHPETEAAVKINVQKEEALARAARALRGGDRKGTAPKAPTDPTPSPKASP